MAQVKMNQEISMAAGTVTGITPCWFNESAPIRWGGRKHLRGANQIQAKADAERFVLLVLSKHRRSP